jgi:L-malate glycosyltransferase
VENKTKRKILFLSPYPVGKAPSQRLKFEQYYPVFEKEGFEITTSSFVSSGFYDIIYKPGHLFRKMIYVLMGYLRRWADLFRIRNYDIVYLHLWVAPLGFPFFEMMTALLAKKLVYDIDDMIFLGHVSRANRWSFFSKERQRQPIL